MSSETPKQCQVCLSAKATSSCGLCSCSVCKKCRVALDPEAFLYMPKIPAALSHANYCVPCYDTQVAPARSDYEVLAEKAKDIYFLTKAYPGYIRVLRRHTRRVVIEDCADRRDTILSMAYQAAQLGMNALIESEVESFNTRKGHSRGYQSARWKGSAMPALVDGDQLERTSLRRT
jgi:hypothetical protein